MSRKQHMKPSEMVLRIMRVAQILAEGHSWTTAPTDQLLSKSTEHWTDLGKKTQNSEIDVS